jgi:hypothetical protein
MAGKVNDLSEEEALRDYCKTRYKGASATPAALLPETAPAILLLTISLGTASFLIENEGFAKNLVFRQFSFYTII